MYLWSRHPNYAIALAAALSLCSQAVCSNEVPGNIEEERIEQEYQRQRSLTELSPDFLPWNEFVIWLKQACDAIDFGDESHSGVVRVKMKDGSFVVSIEPESGIFYVKLRNTCRNSGYIDFYIE